MEESHLSPYDTIRRDLVGHLRFDLICHPLPVQGNRRIDEQAMIVTMGIICQYVQVHLLIEPIPLPLLLGWLLSHPAPV